MFCANHQESGVVVHLYNDEIKDIQESQNLDLNTVLSLCSLWRGSQVYHVINWSAPLWQSSVIRLVSSMWDTNRPFDLRKTKSLAFSSVSFHAQAHMTKHERLATSRCWAASIYTARLKTSKCKPRKNALGLDETSFEVSYNEVIDSLLSVLIEKSVSCMLQLNSTGKQQSN